MTPVALRRAGGGGGSGGGGVLRSLRVLVSGRTLMLAALLFVAGNMLARTVRSIGELSSTCRCDVGEAATSAARHRVRVNDDANVGHRDGTRQRSSARRSVQSMRATLLAHVERFQRDASLGGARGSRASAALAWLAATRNDSNSSSSSVTSDDDSRFADFHTPRVTHADGGSLHRVDSVCAPAHAGLRHAKVNRAYRDRVVLPADDAARWANGGMALPNSSLYAYSGSFAQRLLAFFDIGVPPEMYNVYDDAVLITDSDAVRGLVDNEQRRTALDERWTDAEERTAALSSPSPPSPSPSPSPSASPSSHHDASDPNDPLAGEQGHESIVTRILSDCRHLQVIVIGRRACLALQYREPWDRHENVPMTLQRYLPSTAMRRHPAISAYMPPESNWPPIGRRFSHVWGTTYALARPPALPQRIPSHHAHMMAYLDALPTLLKQLTSFLFDERGLRNDADFVRRRSLVVMIVNAPMITLLANWVCSARALWRRQRARAVRVRRRLLRRRALQLGVRVDDDTVDPLDERPSDATRRALAALGVVGRADRSAELETRRRAALPADEVRAIDALAAKGVTMATTLRRVLIVTTDEPAQHACTLLAHDAGGLHCWFAADVFQAHGIVTSMVDGPDYGTGPWLTMMWAKAVAVHLCMLARINILFQDVDLVWYRDALEYFVPQHEPPHTAGYRFDVDVDGDAADPGDVRADSRLVDVLDASTQRSVQTREQLPEGTVVRGSVFDVYMSDDGARHAAYAPSNGNTGFFFLYANDRTKFFAEQVAFHFDLIQTWQSHQAVFDQQLAFTQSLLGLAVTVLPVSLFPTGRWQHVRSYMTEFLRHLPAARQRSVRERGGPLGGLPPSPDENHASDDGVELLDALHRRAAGAAASHAPPISVDRYPDAYLPGDISDLAGPFVWHMCWTPNSLAKRRRMKQLGMWYLTVDRVDAAALRADAAHECCVADLVPRVSCQGADRASLVPCKQALGTPEGGWPPLDGADAAKQFVDWFSNSPLHRPSQLSPLLWLSMQRQAWPIVWRSWRERIIAAWQRLVARDPDAANERLRLLRQQETKDRSTINTMHAHGVYTGLYN